MPAAVVMKIPVKGEFAIAPQNSNLLRMDDFAMSIRQADGNFSPAKSVPAAPIVNQLAVGGFEYKPGYRFNFGQMSDMLFPEIKTRYEYAFENGYQGPVRLVMEPGSIRGDWTIRINDVELEAKDFSPVDDHVRGSLGVDIGRTLVKGINRVVIECTTTRMDGGLRNPLYLAGDFGVSAPARLTAPVRLGLFEDYLGNWMPYFAGKIRYSGTFTLNHVPAAAECVAELELPKEFAEALRISINSGPWRNLPWNPRSFRIAVSELRAGENKLELEVSTTLIRPFDGQYFDAGTHSLWSCLSTPQSLKQ